MIKDGLLPTDFLVCFEEKYQFYSFRELRVRREVEDATRYRRPQKHAESR